MSSYEHVTDATDLKLRFWRFLGFSLRIKSNAVYLGNRRIRRFVPDHQRASRNGLILAQTLAQPKLARLKQIKKRSGTNPLSCRFFGLV